MYASELWPFSSTFTPALCSPPPPAGMMWTTVWPPLWGLDDVLDVTLLKRAVSPTGRWPLAFILWIGGLWTLTALEHKRYDLYMCMPQCTVQYHCNCFYLLLVPFLVYLYKAISNRSHCHGNVHLTMYCILYAHNFHRIYIFCDCPGLVRWLV